MEVVRCGNAMAASAASAGPVSFREWRSRRRRRRSVGGLLWQQQKRSGATFGTVRAEAAGRGGRREGLKMSLMMDNEVEAEERRFADEEDYVKAGGSEISFVEMQATKAMERQGKIADRVEGT